MPEYRVRPGRNFGPGRIYTEGDIITLTEYEAGGFLDILEKIDDTDDIIPTKTLSEVQQALGGILGDELTLQLTEAGFNTLESLRAAETGQLLSVNRIGPATVTKIKEALQ